MRIVKICLDLGFSQELISVLQLLRERRRKDFDDDLSLEGNVPRQVKLAHSASLKALPNHIILDLLSWLEFRFRQLGVPLSFFEGL
jgi:hypothetical protein